jgi:ABC-type glycerol-3-phosphate transport system substrate-binding protein
MIKRTFSMLSLLIVMSMILTACGGAAAPAATESPKVDKLRVWIQWGDNPQQIQTLFDKYTAATGIKVEVTAPLEEDKILPSLTGSEPPDVLVLSGGDLVKSYAKEYASKNHGRAC